MWGFLAFAIAAGVATVYAISLKSVPILQGTNTVQLSRGTGLFALALAVYALTSLLGTASALRLGMLIGTIMLLGSVLFMLFAMFEEKMDLLLPAFLFAAVCVVGLRLLVFPQQAYLESGVLIFNEAYLMIALFSLVFGLFLLMSTWRFMRMLGTLTTSSRVKTIGRLSTVGVVVGLIALMAVRSPYLVLVSVLVLTLGQIGLIRVNSKVRRQIAESYVPAPPTTDAPILAG